jgi:hypothetical protein
VSGWAVFAEKGNLMTYGPVLRESQGRLAVFVDRILKGAKAADLPVEQPTVHELVINRRVAKDRHRGSADAARGRAGSSTDARACEPHHFEPRPPGPSPSVTFASWRSAIRRRSRGPIRFRASACAPRAQALRAAAGDARAVIAHESAGRRRGARRSSTPAGGV